VVNLFRGPNRIESIGSVVDRLESGDLKLRVRALEAERALTRVQVRGAARRGGARRGVAGRGGAAPSACGLPPPCAPSAPG
jgi:hypothetical protein